MKQTAYKVNGQTFLTLEDATKARNSRKATATDLGDSITVVEIDFVDYLEAITKGGK